MAVSMAEVTEPEDFGVKNTRTRFPLTLPAPEEACVPVEVAARRRRTAAIYFVRTAVLLLSTAVLEAKAFHLHQWEDSEGVGVIITSRGEGVGTLGEGSFMIITRTRCTQGVGVLSLFALDGELLVEGVTWAMVTLP